MLIGLPSRKRRCDAGKPSCLNCIEAEVACQYDDTPLQRIDASGGSREILNKLRHVESVLESHTQAVAALCTEIRSRPNPREDLQGTSPNSFGTGPIPSSGAHRTIPFPQWPSPTHDASQSDVGSLPPLDIPVKHKTSSNYLLGLPAMQALVGEYPNNLFFLLESKNELPPELSFPSLTTNTTPLQINREMTDYLVTTFFARVHDNHPILDEETFRGLYDNFLMNGMDSSIESAICLVVFALSSVALASPEFRDFSRSPPGMEYMQHAMPTLINLSAWSFSYRILLPQALVLASIYFAYIVRPLQSWRMIYSASTIIHFKLSGFDPRHDSPDSRESLLRLIWSSFLVECDRLAELELPRSGLQQFVDDTPLPNLQNLGEMQSTCFLAEISIRRLLNRIHNSLYPQKHHHYLLRLSSTALMAPDEFSTEEISSMIVVCDELQRQLDLWHTSIPERYRPSLTIGPTENDREAVLRIRYFAARHIIYRPFALNIAMNGVSPQSEPILEKAAICIESCRMYLQCTTNILKKPSPYTWTFSISSLGAVIVLTLSSLSPSLKHLVPDIDDLQSLAISNVQQWRISSLSTVVAILEDMQRKQRILSCL